MSLIAWYPLNENTNDYSGNGFNATSSNLTYVAGKTGQAGNFNGSSSSVSSPSALSPLAETNISFWFKWNSFNIDSIQFIIAGFNEMMEIHTCGASGINGLRFIINTNPNSSLDILNAIPDNGWNHYSVNYNNLKTTVFRNGVEIGSKNHNITTIISSNIIYIGKRASNTYFLNGLLNDVRIYNNTLSEKEIKEIAKAKILHYTFDDFQEPTENILSLSGYDSEIERSGTTYPYTTLDITTTVRAKWTATNNNITLSLEGKRDGADGYPVAYIYFTDWSWALTAGTTSATWAFTFSTAAMPDPSAKTVYFAVYHMPSTSAGLSYSRKHQLEFKPYYTPFVQGVRSGIINDSSGLKNNAILTLSTTPQWVSDSKVGSGAYKFNGFNSYITTPNLYATPTITVSLWFKSNTLHSGNLYWGTGTNKIILRTNSDGTLSWYIGTSTTGAGYFNSDSIYSIGVWNHIVVQYDGTNIYAYFNGVKQSTISAVSGSVVSSSLNIGTNYNMSGGWFNGTIDDIKIYTHPLSDINAFELYQTRANIDNKNNLFICTLKQKFYKSAYEIQQNHPNAKSGIYTIQPDPNSDPFAAYCDMDTAGGGWTLLVTSASNTGWTISTVRNRNQNKPTITDNYSILDVADKIKSNIDGKLYYRLDAETFGNWGGIWSAPFEYTFIKMDNTQTNVVQTQKFGTYTYPSGDGIEAFMPWLGSTSGLLTSSAIANSNWWGTIVSNGGFNPAPWISPEATNPGKIWYWVK